MTSVGQSDDRLQLAAAGVEPAARARVAAPRALHHPAALLAGRPEIPALSHGREHRRAVGQRRRGGAGGGSGATLAAGAVAVSVTAVVVLLAVLVGLGVRGFCRPGCVAVVRARRVLSGHPGADLAGEDPEVLLEVGVEEP